MYEKEVYLVIYNMDIHPIYKVYEDFEQAKSKYNQELKESEDVSIKVVKYFNSKKVDAEQLVNDYADEKISKNRLKELLDVTEFDIYDILEDYTDNTECSKCKYYILDDEELGYCRITGYRKPARNEFCILKFKKNNY